jgi:hypothetical protein
LPLCATLPAFFLVLPLTALALFLAFLPGPMTNSLCPEATDAMPLPRRTAPPIERPETRDLIAASHTLDAAQTPKAAA